MNMAENQATICEIIADTFLYEDDLTNSTKVNAY